MQMHFTFVLTSFLQICYVQALRRIMDTRLCKAGRLHAVYIRTDEGVLIKVEPRATIPESLEKFCCMMC